VYSWCTVAGNVLHQTSSLKYQIFSTGIAAKKTAAVEKMLK
jgi:hypothetical protein